MHRDEDSRVGTSSRKAHPISDDNFKIRIKSIGSSNWFSKVEFLTGFIMLVIFVVDTLDMQL